MLRNVFLWLILKLQTVDTKVVTLTTHLNTVTITALATAAVSNLLANPGFERVPFTAGWQFNALDAVVQPDTGHDSPTSVALVCPQNADCHTGAYFYYTQNLVPTNINQHYSFSFDVKYSGAPEQDPVSCDILGFPNADILASVIALDVGSASWQHMQGVFSPFLDEHSLVGIQCNCGNIVHVSLDNFAIY
jgi:hypothetical protein